MPYLPDLSFEALDAASADDFGGMAALHASSFSENESWTPRDFQASARNPSHWGLIARCKDEIIGFVVLLDLSDEASEILTIVVSPNHRRSGFGRALLNKVSAAIAERNRSELLLEVAADNQPAISAYTVYGFQQNGLRKRYYRRKEDELVDAILMIKLINPRG